MIKMFILAFLSILPQPPRDNPWLVDPTNKKITTSFHCQCNYLLGFQASRKISYLVLEKKWPRNDTDVKDDPYQTPTFFYDKEMD
jgi:hypothetical protein